MLEYHMDPLPGSYHYSPTLDDFAKSFPFYCTEAGEYVMGDKYYTKRDDFQSFLLILTTDGCGRMSYKGQNCLLEKESAVLIDCSLYQEYATLPGHRWHFYYIHFNALSLKGYRETLMDTLTPVKLRSLKYGCELMEQICRLSHHTDILSYAAQSNAISCILTEMLYSLVNDNAHSFSLNRMDVAALAEYIHNHCTEQLHLDDFTQFINLSKHHLIRVFGKQFGMSPYKYMHLCRVNRAQNLLRTTDMTVAQIAYAVGYNDPVIFIRHFRTFNGTPPGAYRKSSIILSEKE